MSDSTGSARLNLTVPRELKARMDAVCEPVNWSAVATAAFQAKLLELESNRRVASMEDVIARMKAADELDEKAAYQAGKEAGECWAKEKARPTQLRALDKARQDAPWGGGVASLLSIYTNGMNGGIALGLFRDLHPRKKDVDHRDAAAFWEEVLGDDSEAIEGHDFAHGFCEGAMEVWQTVEGQL